MESMLHYVCDEHPDECKKVDDEESHSVFGKFYDLVYGCQIVEWQQQHNHDEPQVLDRKLLEVDVICVVVELVFVNHMPYVKPYLPRM